VIFFDAPVMMRQPGAAVQALRPLRGRADARAWTPPPPWRDRTPRRSARSAKIKRVTRELTVRVATDKQGSVLVRWAAVEAVQRVPASTVLGQLRDQVGARRGRNIGVVAAARELTELVYYGLRDGRIRRLSSPPPRTTPSRTPAA
jgi:hypothetical protein